MSKVDTVQNGETSLDKKSEKDDKDKEKQEMVGVFEIVRITTSKLDPCHGHSVSQICTFIFRFFFQQLKNLVRGIEEFRFSKFFFKVSVCCVYILHSWTEDLMII